MWGLEFPVRVMSSSPGLFAKLLTLHASSLVCSDSTTHTGAEDMPLPSIVLGLVGHVEVDCRHERNLVLFSHM